jgi:putative ABC transport system permease protein
MSTLSVVRTASGGVLPHKVQAFVLCMVLLVATASATLGLALLEASNGPFAHAFVAQQGADITLTVNADRATAAQLAATAHAPGVTAAAGPFTQVTFPVNFQGQPFGSIQAVGRSAPASPVDTVDLNSGHWPDGPGQLVIDSRPGVDNGPNGQLELGSTFQATTLPGEPILTVVGFATSITHSAFAWVTPAEATTLRAEVATVSASSGAAASGGAASGGAASGGAASGGAASGGAVSGDAASGGAASGGAASGGATPSSAASTPPVEQMLYRFASAGTSAQIRTDEAALAKTIPASAILGTNNWLNQESRSDNNSAIMEPFVIAFALIGLIMAVLIVSNVVSGAVVAQYQRIGVLKSLGMTPGQVIVVYLNRIGWPALVGCAIGVLLGDLLSVPILGRSAGAYGVGHQSVPPWVLVAAPLGMLTLTMLAAFGPALRAGRLSATEAIAAGRAPKSGHGYLAHRLLSKLSLPRPVSLGLAAPFGRPGRTAVTLFAIAFGATAVIFAIGLTTSLNRVQADGTQSATVPVQIQWDGPGQAAGPDQNYPSQAQDDAVTTILAAHSGAAHYDAVYDGNVSVPAIAGQVQAQVFSGASSWQGWTMITGHWLSGPGQVVVNTDFLDQSGLSVGDTTTVNDTLVDGGPADGGTLSSGAATVTVKIVGELFDPSNQPDVYASTQTLPGVATLVNLGQWNIGLRPGTSTSSYSAGVNRALGGSSPWAATSHQGGGQFFTIASALIGLLSLMVAVASGLGVLNTVLMTTRDRVHDLGIFKTIGMRPGQVLAMVCCWVIGPAIIAAVLAAPAAVQLNTATLHAMASAAHTGIPGGLTDVFPLPRLALLSLAALVIAAAGALLPASWAATARPAVALRAE